MTELARACGVSKALVYHYITNKESLLFDILRAYLDDLDLELDRAGANGQVARDNLHALIRALLVQYRQAGNIHKLLIFEIGVLAPEQQAELRAKQRRVMKRFEKALGDAAREAAAGVDASAGAGAGAGTKAEVDADSGAGAGADVGAGAGVDADVGTGVGAGAGAGVDARAGADTPLEGPRVMMLFGTLNWTYTWFRDEGKLSLDAYCELLTDATIASLIKKHNKM